MDELQKVSDETAAMTDETAKAHAYHDAVLPAMAKLRASADAAEEICREDYWPLPCYSRLLYYTELIGRQHFPCYFLLAVQIRSGVPPTLRLPHKDSGLPHRLPCPSVQMHRAG